MEKQLMDIVTNISDVLWSSVLIILLVGLGIYFTIRMGFVQFRMLPEMLRLLFQGTDKGKDGVSPFQAFAISTAARVGTGNIAGVATAIALGGPGAVFWMWLIALIGSASAFVESTLAQIYKVRDEKAWRGGPAYYMEKALGQRWLGIVFSILITISFGFVFNSVQSNTISLSLQSQYGIDKMWITIALVLLTSLVIFGGVRSIATVSAFLVPIMAGGYILIALFIMITNLELLPNVFGLIFQEGLLEFKTLAGGAIGAAVLNGIRRGLFSNEAGMGSAPNAAATAEVSHPVKQGLIQSFGVFVDTLLICSSTAMIILVSDVATKDANGKAVAGIELAQNALSTQVGVFATTFMALAIFLFAFSSIIGNYYYGESNISFINDNKTLMMAYRVIVLGMIVFGSVVQTAGLVWALADIFMGLMAVVNLYAIFRLSKIAKLALDDYLEQRKAGKDPRFYANSIPNLPGKESLEAWETDESKEKAI
ncbi:MAG: alanine/glycine:cation symporter family protein [Exiguobacterium oxidotolerans]|uniref:alanine/glycine:cation symporter family protein n=1 Tax=unclassified Exiguobacterium TaxID=2644629 RepID=UPI001BE81ACA|nr:MULTISPECIES: alanine/glycine:cation symporter family protein [unclassified Exiguobacterium]